MAGQLTIDSLKASSGVLATQNGMTGIAKAWVNFAGASGTINGSFNVSSVTRISTGTYTVNFSTAMPNTTYSVVACGDFALGTDGLPFLAINITGTNGSKTTSGVGITSFIPSFSLSDVRGINVTVFSS